MRRIRFVFTALIAGALVSACADETPTAPSAPARPAFDAEGGGWMGGGGRITPDTGSSTSNADGGGWMGGGGKVASDTTGAPPK